MVDVEQTQQAPRVEINSQVSNDSLNGNSKRYVHILHVDDDVGFLEVSKQILLMQNNFDIDVATSVDEALEKMDKQNYDAIVSDYEMPSKNGIDFLKELREQNNQIPFILFTGRGREDVAVKALNLGADRYLNKNGSTETVYCELAHAINKIVEQEKSREILRESEERYRELANSLPNIIFETNMNGQVVFTNKMGYETSGYSQGDLEKELNIMQFISSEDKERALKNIQLLLAGRESFPIEYTFVRKDGTTFPALITTALIICQNKVTGLRGLVLDITERKKAEEIVRKSEERYRELANSLPEIVFETDLTGKITFFSKQALEVTGFTGEELEKGLNMLSFVIPGERERAAMNMKKSMAGENIGSNEYTLSRKDGTTFPAFVSTSPIISENKATGLRGLVIDISERKKAEEIVRKSEEMYRELANFLPVIVFETDLTGKITFFSTRAFELTGITPEDIEKGSNIISFVLPQERERAIENMKKSMVGEDHGANEYTLVRKNGTTYPALVRTTPIICKNRAIGVRGLVIDITERKKAEMDLKESRDKLELMNEKLRVVGSLSRHDVRNKLSAVNGYTYLLKKKHADQTDVVEGLEKIEQQVKDSAKIFEFAKMYEQLGVEELTYIDVGKAVDEAVALFPGLNTKVVNDCQGVRVLADSFLRQMFYNFIDNTRKYGEKATTAKVYCDQEEQDGLRLIYEDDGVGILAENKSKLFKEGFSTGGSTGFGLFLINKMMDVYGWKIEEAGEEGKGVKFVITIPKTKYC